MKYHLELQFRLLNRHIKDFGLSPVIAYFIVTTLFITFSLITLPRHPYIPYAYGLLALFFTGLPGNVSRNTFLKYCYPTRLYYLIRLTENLIITVPFSVFLLWYQHYIIVAGLVLIASLSIFFSTRASFNITIPTPFSRYPFEFTSGFRSTFYLFILSFFLTYMGIQVDNYNLCFVALLMAFLTTMSYYFVPEPEYYVWIFAANAKKFLLNKIKTALLFSCLLSLPASLSILYYFPAYSLFTLTAIICGCVYLCLIIISKYQSYPDPIGLPYLFMIAFSILFPPVALGLIFIFYSKTIQKLKHYLK